VREVCKAGPTREPATAKGRRLHLLHPTPAALALADFHAEKWPVKGSTRSLIGPLLDHNDPVRQDLASAFLPPSPAHPLGTDDLGRDE
jgi:ABC-type dipeptide/oligopeptide/nickel transport system permease subunit